MGKERVGGYLVGHSVGQEWQVVGTITRTLAQHRPLGFTLGVNIQRSTIHWKTRSVRHAVHRITSHDEAVLLLLFPERTT